MRPPSATVAELARHSLRRCPLARTIGAGDRGIDFSAAAIALAAHVLIIESLMAPTNDVQNGQAFCIRGDEVAGGLSGTFR
jgi:hypothetical protein